MIGDAIDEIADIMEEEQEAFDNIPELLQFPSKGDKMQSAWRKFINNINLLHNLRNIGIFAKKIKTMKRQEFSAQLAAIRKTTDVKIKDLCYALDALNNAVYNLEGGKFNYDTKRMLAYCQCVGIELEIHYAGTNVVIDNYDTLLSTIIDVRKSAGHSQRSIASAIGVSQPTIAYTETQKNTLTIDVMLKICDTCDAVITIKRKEAKHVV